jgi:hypothetical protein
MGKWKETVGEGFGTGRHKGEKREHPVTDERDGTVGGKHVEHWDGRQDAIVQVKPVNAKSKTQGDENA